MICNLQDTAVRRDEARPASSAPVDLDRIAGAVREILHAVGEDPDRPGLVDTPRRVAKAYAELFAGLRDDPGRHLARVFPDDSDDVIVVRDIEFFSVCEHHLLPFHGRAHVAYLPGEGRVVGLSKIARTVETFARRPQMQERLTRQVADALMTGLGARGALVAVEGEHMCMKMRGVRSRASVMSTVTRRGVFRDDAGLARETLARMGCTPGPA